MSVSVAQELAADEEEETSPEARLPVLAGDIVADKYEVERILGTGGMGVVVAAVHLDLHEKVAIKFMLPEMAAHPSAANRFLREAQATSRLKSERVARLHDVDKLPDGTPFMVMELLEGETLDQLMQREVQIEVTRLVDLVLQACEPLDEAHRIGIVHRDVKPENLFMADRVDEGPIVKVLDFGISKVQSSISITISNGMMGTASYSSPEQLKNASEVGPSADVWSLGVILFEGLTGTMPFLGSSFAEICASVLHETPRRARQLRPDVPVGLDEVVARCIDRRAPDRIVTVPELAAGLAPFASEEGFALATRIMKRSSNRPEASGSWPPAATVVPVAPAVPDVVVPVVPPDVVAPVVVVPDVVVPDVVVPDVVAPVDVAPVAPLVAPAPPPAVVVPAWTTSTPPPPKDPQRRRARLWTTAAASVGLGLVLGAVLAGVSSDHEGAASAQAPLPAAPPLAFERGLVPSDLLDQEELTGGKQEVAEDEVDVALDEPARDTRSDVHHLDAPTGPAPSRAPSRSLEPQVAKAEMRAKSTPPARIPGPLPTAPLAPRPARSADKEKAPAAPSSSAPAPAQSTPAAGERTDEAAFNGMPFDL